MTLFKTAFAFATILTFSLPEAQAIPYLLSKTEIKKIIGDYPAQGSQAEYEDDKVLLDFQATRTKAECDAANIQGEAETIRTFFGPALSNSEIKYLNIIMAKSRVISGLNATLAKNIYNRPRPFVRNPLIVPCLHREETSSYPSGHSTLARMWGRILSMRFPAREKKIMALAAQVQKNRMLGGVHHPSDIAAANKLGDYLAFKFYK